MIRTYTRAALMAGTFICCALTAGAQDIIHLDDGSEIEAKVKEINQKNIVYRRWDNQNGADYILNRDDVRRIVYENGAEEELSGRGSGRPSPFRDRGPVTRSREARSSRGGAMDPGYGKNILAIAPIQMTNESVAGLGLSYERFIDKGGIFAIYLPVAIAFYQDEVGFQGGPGKDRVYTYLYPGAKFYPGGSDRRVSYSVGPSFAFGFGTKQELMNYYPPGGGVYANYEDVSSFKAGFMVNNGLNIQPTKSLYIGLELGLGILYYSNRRARGLDYDEPLVQFGFKMGYRF